MAETTGKAPKKGPLRSPKYPSLTFADAETKAKLIYQAERRSPTTANVIYQHLGFKKKTGPAGRAVSALRQYGFLEESGGQFRVSERAHRYFNLPEDNPERESIKRELAMKPRLFKEIVAHYADGLPSDATLKSYLVLEKDFNENSVEQFIRGLKAAIAIAKPYDAGYTPSDDSDDDEQDESEEETMDAQVERKGGEPPPPPAKGQLPFPLYLSKTQKAMLYVPASLTRKEYQLLRTQIEHTFLVMEATVLADDAPESEE